MEQQEIIRLNADVPRSTRKTLKLLAVLHDKSMAELLQNIISDYANNYLDNRPEEPKMAIQGELDRMIGVSEGATLVGVSGEAIRGRIKSGALQAQLIDGQFGPTWQFKLGDLVRLYQNSL